jgi:hypothetical protein
MPDAIVIEEFGHIAIEEVHPNPNQPRKVFDPQEMAELTESIKIHDVLKPILVEVDPAGGYMIQDGERRWRAAINAGKSTIPARILRNGTEVSKLEHAMVANLHNSAMTIVEEANGYMRLAGLPGGDMVNLITLHDLTVWVCDPDNWIYIDIDKIHDARLRKLAFKRREHWGDDWWTTAEVAAYHHVDSQDVKRYTKLGYLHGVQPEHSISGRHVERAWRNWRFLRSEATRPDLHFWTLADLRTGRREYSERADQWILKARDELGMSFPDISRSMKWKETRPGQLIHMRYHRIKAEAGQ